MTVTIATANDGTTLLPASPQQTLSLSTWVDITRNYGCVLSTTSKVEKKKKKTSANDETVYKIRHTHTHAHRENERTREREREKRNLDM